RAGPGPRTALRAAYRAPRGALNLPYGLAAVGGAPRRLETPLRGSPARALPTELSLRAISLAGGSGVTGQLKPRLLPLRAPPGGGEPSRLGYPTAARP
ncbi:hypothetical protein ACWGH4_13135, partial [Streptomyces sp. NPDC054847]